MAEGTDVKRHPPAIGATLTEKSSAAQPLLGLAPVPGDVLRGERRRRSGWHDRLGSATGGRGGLGGAPNRLDVLGTGSRRVGLPDGGLSAPRRGLPRRRFLRGLSEDRLLDSADLLLGTRSGVPLGLPRCLGSLPIQISLWRRLDPATPARFPAPAASEPPWETGRVPPRGSAERESRPPVSGHPTTVPGIPTRAPQPRRAAPALPGSVPSIPQTAIRRSWRCVLRRTTHGPSAT